MTVHIVPYHQDTRRPVLLAQPQFRLNHVDFPELPNSMTHVLECVRKGPYTSIPD
jgi:hypothetical protein